MELLPGFVNVTFRVPIYLYSRGYGAGCREADWYRLAATLVYITPIDFSYKGVTPTLLDGSPHPHFSSSLPNGLQLDRLHLTPFPPR